MAVTTRLQEIINCFHKQGFKTQTEHMMDDVKEWLNVSVLSDGQVKGILFFSINGEEMLSSTEVDNLKNL